MKKQTAICIDRSKAIIVTLFNGAEKVVAINSGIENRIYHDEEGNKGTFSGSHHSSNETQFEERKKNQLKKYLNEVLLTIKNADEIYIFGPSETKKNLAGLINEDKSKTHPILKAIETCESGLTTHQIIAKAKDFFKIKEPLL